MKVDNGTTNFAVYEDATEFYGMAEARRSRRKSRARESRARSTARSSGISRQ